MSTFVIVFSTILCLETAFVLLLNLMPRFGDLGKRIAEIWTKAPWLDLVLSLLVWIPWLISSLMVGWIGLVAAIAAQILVMQVWAFSHELAHRKAGQGSCIARFHNQRIGWWRNNLALWATAIVLPGFFLIRLSQIAVYPILVWLLGLPNYRHNEWISVSRQKFQGLVGYDLIWCLYCDWMTGVYSLGAEMLRNVESFWCPIRFYDGKKCENCQLDFPDLKGGWVAADGTMDEVEQLLEQMYSSSHHSWYGHQERQREE